MMIEMAWTTVLFCRGSEQVERLGGYYSISFLIFFGNYGGKRNLVHPSINLNSMYISTKTTRTWPFNIFSLHMLTAAAPREANEVIEATILSIA